MPEEVEEVLDVDPVVDDPAPVAEAVPNVSLTPDMLRGLMQEAVSSALQANTQVQPQQTVFDDPNKYWEPKETEDAPRRQEFQGKIEALIEHKMRNLVNRVQDNTGVLNMMDRMKANNPDTAKHHEAAIQLMQSGKIRDYETALKFSELSSTTSVPTRAQGAKPKSMPARSAVSPSTQRGQSKPPEKQPYYATVYELIQNDPEIQAAMKEGF